MKKFLIITSIVAMCLCSVCACSNKNPDLGSLSAVEELSE